MPVKGKVPFEKDETEDATVVATRLVRVRDDKTVTSSRLEEDNEGRSLLCVDPTGNVWLTATTVVRVEDPSSRTVRVAWRALVGVPILLELESPTT